MKFSFRLAAWFVVCCGLSLGSAAVRAEIDVAAIRGSAVLAEEPSGALSITDAKAKLTATPQPVVVAGRIGGRGREGARAPGSAPRFRGMPWGTDRGLRPAPPAR